MISILPTFQFLMHHLFSQIRRMYRSRNCLELCHGFEIFFKLVSHGLYCTEHSFVLHFELFFVDDGLDLLAIVVFEPLEILVEQCFYRLVDLLTTLLCWWQVRIRSRTCHTSHIRRFRRDIRIQRCVLIRIFLRELGESGGTGHPWVELGVSKPVRVGLISSHRHLLLHLWGISAVDQIITSIAITILRLIILLCRIFSICFRLLKWRFRPT